MAMTVAEAKAVVAEVIEKHKKSIEKEINYKKELNDDTATLDFIKAKVEKGEPLPADCNYSSYDEWKTQIEKEIKATNNALNRINTEKAELIAMEYFVANAPEA